MNMHALSRPARLLVLVAASAMLAAAGMNGTLAAKPVSSSSPGPGTAWDALAAEELARLPPGTQIVDCAPGLPQLPPGVRLSRQLGFFQEHPGFHTLSDGRCAFDPTAIPAPIRDDTVDPSVP